MKLKISDTLSLPIDFVTSTQAILAQKGRGKTYTAQVEAEELLEAGQQVVIIDPTDAWYGLRSSPDGRSTGYAIPVFGGDHGDVPLDPGAGTEYADAIANEHFSAIFCTENMTKGEELRFGAAFFERLYRKNREALHLFIDEADIWAPQKPFGGDDIKALGALDSVVRRGRKKGLGCTLITQRAAVLNKNLLSQIDQLVCLGMHDPRDLAQVSDWVKGHDKDGRGKGMLESLPDLVIGDAWIWNPRAGIFQRITVRPKTTFDSGATPKAGEKAKVAKVLSPVDIKRLGDRIAAAAERTKGDDPKHLRARIAELEATLKQSRETLNGELHVLATKLHKEREARPREVPVLKDAQLARAEHLIAKVERIIDLEAKRHGPLREALSNVTGAAKEVATAIASIKQPSLPLGGGGGAGDGWTRVTSINQVGHPHVTGVAHAGPGSRIPKITMRSDLNGQPITSLRDPTLEPTGAAPRPGTIHYKMLAALAEEPMRGLSRHEIRVFTGYADSGPTSSAMGKLIAEGWAVEATANGIKGLVITQAGAQALGPDYVPLPKGAALVRYLMDGNRLNKAERAILSTLVDARAAGEPTLTRAEIRERTGYADSGPTSSAMTRLCTFGYAIAEGRAGLRAADRLFD